MNSTNSTKNVLYEHTNITKIETNVITSCDGYNSKVQKPYVRNGQCPR